MKMEKNKIVLYLLLFFLILRIGVVIIAGQKESDFADAKSYNGYAAAVLQKGDWLTNPDFLGSARPPVYPVFIALIYLFFGINNFIAVYIFQAFIGTVTCFYIYKLCKRIFNEKAALLSLIWAGFYIPYLRYVRTLLRETLIFFLLIIFFYYLYIYITEESKKVGNFWLISLFYFLLIHLDPRYLFYLPFLAILFLIYQPLWVGVKKYLAFLGITILLIIPWTIRNYIAYEAFVLINTRTLDLREVNSRNHNAGFRLKYNVFNLGNITYSKNIINKNYPTEQERKLIKKGFNPEKRTKDELIAIKNDIYPATSFLSRKWYHFLQLWKPFDFARSYRPFPDARFNGIWSFRHNISSILCYGLLLPFMIFAIYHLIKQKNRIYVILTLPLIVHTLLHILQWGRSRYRIPIDSFVIILGVYGIYLLYCIIKKKGLQKDEINNSNTVF